MQDKILQLLEHENEENVLLGIEIARGVQVSLELATKIFYLAYFHPHVEVNTRAQYFLDQSSWIDVGTLPEKTWTKLTKHSFMTIDQQVDSMLDWLENLPTSAPVTNAAFINEVIQHMDLDDYTGQVFLFCLKHDIPLSEVPRLMSCTRMSFFLKKQRYYHFDKYPPQRPLKSLPKEIGQMVNLTELILDNHELTELPEEIGQLENLQQLYIRNNSLTQLPKNIGQLSNLIFLDMSHNPLEHFPEEILACKNLRVLEGKQCGIKALPDGFGQLKHLHTIDLGYNQLETLPQTFGNLLNLKELALNHNCLHKLPVFFTRFTHLKSLDLSKNHLKRLPERFAQLTSLMDLNLSSNQLNHWYFEARTLFNLRWLDLRDNQITHLSPSTIGLLAGLQQLLIDDNPLPRKEIARFKAQYPEIQIIPLIPKEEWEQYPKAILDSHRLNAATPGQEAFQGRVLIDFVTRSFGDATDKVMHNKAVITPNIDNLP